LSAALSDARAQYDKGNYKQALVSANAFLAQVEKQQAACKASAGACSDGGAALGKAHAEGVELASWMKAIER
jgi:hypothetical protein